MIYLSTGGFNSLSGTEAINYLSIGNFNNIELSGGVSQQNQEGELKSLVSHYNIQIHNYFPPPENPFVLNLASFDDKIAKLSLDHILKAIDLAKILGCDFYSFHAGFLLDPQVSDLGGKFSHQKINHRESAKKIFVKRVNQVSKYAKAKGIMILLENNVISHKNLNHFGTNPFLLTDYIEAIEVMNLTDDNVGLLVDVAHLKVSSHSEGFCKNTYLESTRDFTFAYHLSDNDGTSDTNDKVTAESWFWPAIRKDLNYYSLEVYDTNLEMLAQQIDLTELMLSK